MQLKSAITVMTSTETPFPIIRSTLLLFILGLYVIGTQRTNPLCFTHFQLILIESINQKSIDLRVINHLIFYQIYVVIIIIKMVNHLLVQLIALVLMQLVVFDHHEVVAMEIHH